MKLGTPPFMRCWNALQGAQAAERVGEADVPESDAAESSGEEADGGSSASGSDREDDEDVQRSVLSIMPCLPPTLVVRARFEHCSCCLTCLLGSLIRLCCPHVL